MKALTRQLFFAIIQNSKRLKTYPLAQEAEMYTHYFAASSSTRKSSNKPHYSNSSVLGTASSIWHRIKN
jgi:hypothetical protein